MKAILEFNLPEEQEEFALASSALKLSCVLDDIRAELRNKLKYGELRGKEYAAYENMQKVFFAAVETHGVIGLI